jgi:uncharacterized membrane protein YdjX (TVP38/TMEM64 family)
MRIAVIVFVMVGLLAINFLVFAATLEQWVASAEGLTWLRRQGPLAGLAGAGLIASDLFLPMPSTGVMAALGEIYGGLVGGLYALLGSLSGGLGAYGLVKLLGERGAQLIAGKKNLTRLSRFFHRSGAWAIATTRVIPVVPEVLCCLAGLAPMPFGRFCIALLCGSLPIAFLFTYFGSMSEEEPVTVILTAIAIPALLFLPAFWFMTRRPRSDSRGAPTCR